MYAIHSGTKIIQLTLKDFDIRLIDSLNWLQMPLANLQKVWIRLVNVFHAKETFHIYLIGWEIKIALDLCQISYIFILKLIQTKFDKN